MSFPMAISRILGAMTAGNTVLGAGRNPCSPTTQAYLL